MRVIQVKPVENVEIYIKNWVQVKYIIVKNVDQYWRDINGSRNILIKTLSR
jgi:hypothetical protein